MYTFRYIVILIQPTVNLYDLNFGRFCTRKSFSLVNHGFTLLSAAISNNDHDKVCIKE